MAPIPAAAGRPPPAWTFEAAAQRVQQQDWAGARVAYASLAQEHPGHGELLCNLGLIEQLLQDWPAALEHFSQAAALHPPTPRPFMLRADLHKRCQRLEAALIDYDLALHHGPTDDGGRAHVHANRGTTLHALGRHEEALVSFEKALACDADTPGLHYNRGNALRCLDRHLEAVEAFDQALRAEPSDTQAWFNRSLSLGALGRWSDALESADSLIHLEPEHARAHSARGDWLKNLGRAQEALLAYDEALRLQDNLSATHLNRGNTLRELDRPSEALRAYDRAVQLNPSDWEGHFNRGIALHDLRRVPQALQAYSLARRLSPQEAQVEWNEALALLMGERWHEGWLAYESRWQLEPPAAGIASQAGLPWRGGHAPVGARLLLVAEQGLGDTLQFCRYVPALVALGAQVTLLVPEVLHALLRSLSPGLRVVSSLEAGERFDLHCPLMSLPLALNRFDPGQGVSHPYLAPDVRLVADLARIHPRDDRLRVGLAWSGNPRNPSDARRSLSLRQFAQALPDTPDSGLQGVVLQTEVRPADAEALAALPGLLHDPGSLAGFDRTAAWCAQVDLVVTVDTSIAHLAGALGRPTWLLLHHASDWRWLMGRDDTPWYPQTRLFRQCRPGRWDEPLERVRSALERRLTDHELAQRTPTHPATPGSSQSEGPCAPPRAAGSADHGQR